MLDVNEIDFINLSEVNNEKLLKFYSTAYPYRYKIIHKNWRWLYRTSLSGLEPVIALYKKEIIGHAGLISTNLLYEEKILKAIWFVDFYILSKYRNIGLGKILTKKWMELESCHLTFCNQNSLRIFKKLGWIENDNFYKRCKLINPLKWIPLIRSIDNKFLNRLNILKFFNNKNIIKNIRLLKLTENQKILSDIFFSKKKINNNSNLQIIRDDDWLNWRIFQSPFKKNYYFASIENSFIILSILRNDNKKKLNIIFTSYENEQDKILLNRYIVSWSIENNVDIIWLQLDNIDTNTINNFYPKKFKLNFACNSDNISINKNILKNLPNIDGLDSDIDIRNYEDKHFDF